MSRSHQSIAKKSKLYTIVFRSAWAQFLVLPMLFFFIFQPVASAFAEENSVDLSSETQNTDAGTEPLAEMNILAPTVTTENDNNLSVNDDSNGDNYTLNDLSPSGPVVDIADNVKTVQIDKSTTSSKFKASTTEGLISDGGNVKGTTTTNIDFQPADASNTADESVATTFKTVVAEPLATSTDDTEVLDDTQTYTVSDSSETDSNSTDLIVNVSSDHNSIEDLFSTATVTEDVALPTIAETSDNRYEFSKNQCLSVGDGAYHCFDAKRAVIETSADTVYSERDSTGDFEIFFNDGESVQQITKNVTDDTSPAYDPVSDSIVWQRLVDGRYVIFSYSLEAKTEIQLSDSNINSMEPTRSGGNTVWQAWENNAWAIVLNDGSGKKVISKGSGHNIAPHIQGNYVIWNTTNGTEQVVTVYDTKTGMLSTINDSESALVENPRFVLVYDSKFANGDIVTKGYDAGTGQVIPLAAQPPATPKPIPPSDQTGETRALIQTKTQSREEADGDLDIKDTSQPQGTTTKFTDATSTVAVSATSATTSIATTSDIVVQPNVEIATSSTSTILVLTDFDIIVEPFSSSSTQSVVGTSTTNDVN